MFIGLQRFIAGLVLALAVLGCAQPPLSIDPATVQADGVVRVVPEYRLGPADKVRVNVFGEEALTGEFTVGGSGRLSLPLIGEVQAEGLTITQLQESIAQALRQGFINEPRVNAEVLNYRPFYILGEVNKPGEYPYTANLSVLNAVATAEGFTYRADTRRVYIKRADGAFEQAYPLTTATQVAPGDTIRIGERFF
ncbi:polysaccharide biosynthesis/export family protein [Brevundimonas sp. TWP2-3-4b1]|uniref:polysaccharide biosynthesis/export family protein n=1 Tax=Brevundimonas sp. TWP2-3-4b1 TaxID=2804580 RepID=UPI003CF901DB